MEWTYGTGTYPDSIKYVQVIMTQTPQDRTHFLTGALLALAMVFAVHPAFAASAGGSSTQPISKAHASTTAHKVATKPQPWTQVGTASWYGGQFHGRNTSNGEVYDMYRLTCAHRDLPLGSWVKVTNLHNHKWVVLRVNDRGPFVDDRIVDLSYAAAQMLSINGVAKVKLELMPQDQPTGPVQPTTLAQLSTPSHGGR